ncbi:hypothetical protein ACN4EG_08055 [Alkalinema pantanalense CENA528]
MTTSSIELARSPKLIVDRPIETTAISLTLDRSRAFYSFLDIAGWGSPLN